MLRRATLASTLLLLPLLACGDDDEASDSAGSTSGAGSTGEGSTSGATTTAPTTGEASATTGEASATTGDVTTGATTGGAMFCNGWEDVATPAYLELANRDGAPLVDGATLPLECGGQGVFMFGLYPRFGGFTPDSQLLDFAITVDVEGFNDNPDGHFYSTDPVGYSISCDPVIGGVTGVLPVFPLDELADLTVLHGKPATVHVVLHAPGGDVAADASVVLSVVKDDSWGFCGG